MSRKLKLLSLNVRGLRNSTKRRAIFSCLKAQKASETYSLPEDEKVWSAEWGGKIFYSHGTAHSKGVCTLLNPSCTFQLSSIQTDPQGRFLIAKIIIEEECYYTTNVYAPNDFRDQDDLIKTLSEQVTSKPDTSKVIIAGDSNTTLNQIDKRGGLPWKPKSYRNALIDLMEEINIIDIYRQLHPSSKSFTYESRPLNLKSRIDFFLISRPLSCDVKIRVSIAPDYKSIFLNIEIKSEFQRGPGLWKFNNSLLEDENYKELIAFYYPQILQKYSDVVDKQLLWELIKMELRSKTIRFSNSKRYNSKCKEETLQNELQELDEKICNGGFFGQGLLDNYEALKKN